MDINFSMFTGIKTLIFLNGYKLVHVNRDFVYVYRDVNFNMFTRI